MTVFAAGLAGGLTTAGIVLVIAWFLHTDTQLSTGFFTRLGRKLRIKDGRTRRRTLVAVIVGVTTCILTGWVILGVILGTAIVGLPWLLATPPQRDIEVLEALDRWLRAIAATLPTGRSIADALRSSRRQAPALLRPSVELAVRRLDERWSAREALFAMADDLDSPDADAALASLALAAERGGTGATATLAALADSVQDRLRARREIETERAKPRIVVRQVTAITVGLLALAFLFGQGFFMPYRTPLGQLILAFLIAAYVGSLVIMRRMTLPRRRARILRRQP